MVICFRSACGQLFLSCALLKPLFLKTTGNILTFDGGVKIFFLLCEMLHHAAHVEELHFQMSLVYCEIRAGALTASALRLQTVSWANRKPQMGRDLFPSFPPFLPRLGLFSSQRAGPEVEQQEVKVNTALLCNC